MTFEDYELSLNLDLEQIDDRYILDISRNAWNAAIASSLNAVDAAFFKCPADGDVSVDMRKSIEKLLTA